MNTRMKKISADCGAAALMLLFGGCLFWQLTADRTVAYCELQQSVLYTVTHGDRLYAKVGDVQSGSARLVVFDVSNPLEVAPVSSGEAPDTPSSGFESILFYDKYLLATARDYIAVIDPTLPSGTQSINEFGISDVPDGYILHAIYSDYYLRVVNSYPDTNLTLKVYEMSDIIGSAGYPPNEISSFTLSGTRLTSGAAGVVGSYLYLATTSVFCVFDLTDVNAPSLAGSCALSEVPFGGLRLAFHEDRAYVLPAPSANTLVYRMDETNDAGDVAVVDISNPKAPSVVSSIEGVRGPCALSGSYLLARSGESIDVYDLSNLAEGSVRATLNVRSSASAIHVMGDFALLPEAKRESSAGIATVLIAPYR